MSTTLGRKAAVIAVYAEKYVLSLVFLYAAQNEFHKLWVGWSGPPGTASAVFVGVVRHVIFFLLNLFVGLLLLLGRRAVVPPQKLKDILIPLASSLAPLMYQTIPWFPISLQKSLCPPDLQMPLAAVGLFLGITGPVVAIWSVLYLGRSFGILVGGSGRALQMGAPPDVSGLYLPVGRPCSRDLFVGLFHSRPNSHFSVALPGTSGRSTAFRIQRGISGIHEAHRLHFPETPAPCRQFAGSGVKGTVWKAQTAADRRLAPGTGPSHPFPGGHPTSPVLRNSSAGDGSAECRIFLLVNNLNKFRCSMFVI